MSTRLITAYYMHETERVAAEGRMPQALVTDAFVHGEIDDEQIEYLRRQGLIIEVHEEDSDDDDEMAAPAAAADDANAEAGFLDSLESRAEDPFAFAPPAETGFYILRMRRPLLPVDDERLREMEVELIERVCPVRERFEDPGTRLPERLEYKARLRANQVDAVRGLDFVRSAYLYDAGQTPVLRRPDRPADPDRAGVESDAVDLGLESFDDSAPAARTFDIVLHRPADEHEEDRDAVLEWLGEHAVPVTGMGRRKIRVELDPALEDQTRALPEVAFLDEYVEPELLNDEARRILGVDPATPGAHGIPFQGMGQVVGIADSGLDETHKDFDGRIKKVFARARPGDASDTHGHGTHVAGSVVGTGKESGGQIRGVAPEAEIVFQSIRGDDGKLKLPVDLGELFQEAYDLDARIHNNSWGANTASQYRSTSFDVDDFVWRRRDMLVVIAAGNHATAVTDAVPPRVGKGFPDWLSISAPATSKNALVVGASRSSRTAGGYADKTWGDQWPEEFPPPDGISGETVSGNPDCLAGFSSRGPCMDDRVKPDVVAPGTDILSTRASSVEDDDVFWGAGPDEHYAYMGGTSMAAPLVAGCAAIVRQYFDKKRGHAPSAALLKATIINGTRWLPGPDAVEGHANTPNFHQGFGAVHLPTTIPNDNDPKLKLEFFDPWNKPATWFTQSGLARQWDLTVNGGAELRICLVYTDLPASGLQNRLHLFASDSGTGRWVGNQDLPYNPKRVPDPYNNVQVIRIVNPPAGEYRIKVAATSIRQPQDFALVVTGDFDGSL